MFTPKTGVILASVASILVPSVGPVVSHISTTAACLDGSINDNRRYKEKLAPHKSDCKADEKKDCDI